MKRLGIFAILPMVLYSQLFAAQRVNSARAAALPAVQNQTQTTGTRGARSPSAQKQSDQHPAMQTPTQAGGGISARAASKTKVMDTKKVKTTASFAKGIEDDPCKMEYWGCMDQFCMSENDSGGRCACSQDSVNLDRQYNQIVGEFEENLAKTNALSTDIETGGDIRAQARALVLNADDTDEEEEEEETGGNSCKPDDVACQIGAAKMTAAAKMCDARVSNECKGNHSFVKMQYSQNIRQDCNAYVAAIKDAQTNGAKALYEAKKQMRETALDKFESENKWDESQCRIELRDCMSGTDACGADWSRCMKTGVESKRIHCENKVLDNCAAVRENVWDGFVAEIAPTLRAAEITSDNDRRQNCLGRITDCVVKACKDDIEGKGVATMDACLARPEMAQSFCKVELDDCDENGRLWNFAKAKLNAMRVDKCQEEVKNCLEDEGRCGKDYSNCLGLDLPALHDMCPVDKLVVCRQANPNFSMSDLGNMVMGIFMNIDNKALEQCQEIVEDKMIEICGSLVNCDREIDPEIGTRSLRYQMNGGEHIISGTVNWGGLKVSGGDEWKKCISNKKTGCDKLSKPGDMQISEYIDTAKKSQNPEKINIAPILDLIESEIKSVAGQINRTIGLLDDDPKISACIDGRDMSQITGKKTITTARFPMLTSTYRRIIAEAALIQVKNNYNAKMLQLMAEIEKKADAIEAEYLCYQKPRMVAGRNVPEKTDKTSAASFEAYNVIAKNSASRQELAAMAAEKPKIQIDDILTKEYSMLYSPASRNCHICVIDTFHGKRRYVDPRAGEAEKLKKELERIEKDKADDQKAHAIGAAAMVGIAAAAMTGVGIAAAVTAATAATAVATATALGAVAVTATSATIIGGAAGAVAATTTAMTTLGTAAAASAAVPVVGWIAAGVIAVGIAGFAIWSATNKVEDPMEQVVTRTVDYCFDETIGGGNSGTSTKN